jgi:hypothetical protein
VLPYETFFCCCCFHFFGVGQDSMFKCKFSCCGVATTNTAKTVRHDSPVGMVQHENNKSVHFFNKMFLKEQEECKNVSVNDFIKLYSSSYSKWSTNSSIEWNPLNSIYFDLFNMNPEDFNQKQSTIKERTDSLERK